MPILLDLLLVVPALLIAVTVHEYSHGKVADLLGDPTPCHSGRLSLNPLSHLDFLGSLMIFLVHIGWAKPVPINPNYFKDPNRGMMYVGLAGPLSNLVMAFLAAFPLRVGLVVPHSLLYFVFLYIIKINIALGVFNLTPIPPLDGSRVVSAFLPPRARMAYYSLERYGILILILLLIVFKSIFFAIFIPITNFLMNLVLPGVGWG